MTRNEKLREVINYLTMTREVYNDSDFYTRIGKNKSQMCEVVNGKRTVTPNLVRIICSHFPKINPEYLLDESETEMLNLNHGNVKGNNNMVNNGHDQHVAIENGLKQADKIINTLQAQIERQQAQIDKLLSIIEKMQS